MEITLGLSTAEERQLRKALADQDFETAREVLTSSLDSHLESLRESEAPIQRPSLEEALDKIAEMFPDLPVLPDEAMSRSSIYADHP